MADPYVDVVAWNNAEGGVDGATVTSGTSGGTSGNAFSPQIGGTSAVTFKSAGALHGSMSYSIVSAGGFALLRWLTSTVGELAVSCGALYLRVNTAPSGYSDLVAAYAADAGGTANKCFAIRIGAFGNVRLSDGAAVTIATTTSTIPVGQIVRIEWQINHTTGAYVVEWFLGDSTTAQERLTGTAAAGAFKDATRRIDFGRQTSPEYDITLDTLAINSEKLGPRWVAGTSARVQSVVSNAGSWTAVGETALTALRDGSDATYLETPTSPSAASWRGKLNALSRTDVVTVRTRGAASDSSGTISRTVKVFNGVTELVSDTFTLTTTPTTRSTVTPSPVAAGVELEVLITDTAV